MAEEHDYRPIKIVAPHKDDLRPPRAGGGKKKDFTSNYDESREKLLYGITDIFEYFDDTFAQQNLPAVARVTLREDAMAKSHRPGALFSLNTCPIIGNLDFGELLISIQPNSLKELTTLIERGRTEGVRNDISKILSIEPYKEGDALGGWTMDMFRAFLVTAPSKRIKLRLFDHRIPELNQQLIEHLSVLAQEAGIPNPIQANYGSRLHIFGIDIPSEIERLHLFSAFAGTQSLEPFEQFDAMVQSTPVQKLTTDLLPQPDEEEDYPVVGIIDSGTDPNNAQLQAWVVVRDETLIPRDDQNNEHGSLVAGAIINGKLFNNDHPEFPHGNAKVVDVVAMPSSGKIDAWDLLDALRHAFTAHPTVKVWNLSVNFTNTLCKNESFSDFAIAIDELQDEFNVLIINSVGNFGINPMPKWRRPDMGGRDRISSPADSLRAISVGSIAHLGHPNTCAQPGEPSPFTRRGPGAAYVPKPELSHFGGNTDQSGQFRQVGILSIDNNGHLAETVGTSFAAPLVAATAARLWDSLEGNPPRHLVKAMMIHSAVLNSGTITSEDLPFTGFGKPPSVEEMLRCNPSEATMIFDLDLPYTHRNFNKPNFPVPPCLHRENGKMFGEIIMTLVYDPPVDPYDGAAYSQVNINPSIGMCRTVDDKEKYTGKLIPYPKDYRDLFEKNQIQHGFKWSPVKVFRSSFSHIEPQEMWRISMEMMTRKPECKPDNQPVALIVTIRDPDGEQPVYDEVVAMMSRSGWVTQNLPIKARARVRATN